LKSAASASASASVGNWERTASRRAALGTAM
jgi:hypothetical protein